MNVSKSFRKPYRFKRKKSVFRILKNRFFWLGLLILVFIVGIFYLICFYYFFQIKEVKIAGSFEKVSLEEIQQIVDKKINHKLLFFSSKSIFLVNLNEIRKEISRNFPQINEIKLKRKFPGTLNLEIKERQPFGIWCAGETKKCFIFDKEGIVFEEILEMPAGSLMIKDFQKNQNPILGEKVIEKDNLVLIKNLEADLKEAGVTPTEFIILAEERLNAKTNQNWEIYFDSKGDISSQLTNLKTVLENEIPPQKREKLEYIDLRFGNRVYYKYR